MFSFLRFFLEEELSRLCPFFFFFNDTATTEIYTLSLHDALPISSASSRKPNAWSTGSCCTRKRSEEHTSELQSRPHLVCRLLLEKKKQNKPYRRAGGAVRRLGRADLWRLRDPGRGVLFFFLRIRRPPRFTLFPYTTLFR